MNKKDVMSLVLLICLLYASTSSGQTETLETKYAMNQGHKIAYSVTGSGPAVILQHGWFGRRQSWDAGYIGVLKNHYTVIAVDSLGHGESDKPTQLARYQRKPRAADIIAVMDAEKIDKAHYVGYSMGGWLGIGVLIHYPERLISATIGGWDPTPANPVLSNLRELELEEIIVPMKEADPEFYNFLKNSITAENSPGLIACARALGNVEIPVQQLIDSKVPIHLWIGKQDESYDGVILSHKQMRGARLSEVEGDHLGALYGSSVASVNAIMAFIADIEGKGHE